MCQKNLDARIALVAIFRQVPSAFRLCYIDSMLLLEQAAMLEKKQGIIYSELVALMFFVALVAFTSIGTFTV